MALHVQATPVPSSGPSQSEPLRSTNDVASLWLGQAELIRMSPPQSSQHGVGVFCWEVWKDITRYSFLLEKSNLSLALTALSMSRNESFSASPTYQVNVSIFYYEYSSNLDTRNRKVGSIDLDRGLATSTGEGALKDAFYDDPADLIIPLSDKNQDKGLWFRIESEFDVPSVGLEIPSNTIRVILELHVSSHSEDEFWPSNMPGSTSGTENLSGDQRTGAFKEVFVTIDGTIVGSEVPFPVIYPGSINPLFWEPMVSIGAFDHPTYDIDLTPFLESMTGGGAHEFGIGVSRSKPFWLVSGNLHLWLDDRIQYPVVEARSVLYYYPKLRIEQMSEYKGSERRLELEARRRSRFAGWVKSSEGNFTTRVSQETELENSIRFSLSGKYIRIEHEIETEREVRVETETGELVSRVRTKRSNRMRIVTSVLHRPDTITYRGSANVTMKDKLVRGKNRSRVYSNSQCATGWMTVNDEMVVSGSARTEQNLIYRDHVGGGGCCFRKAAAEKGRLLSDDTSFLCGSSSIV